MKKTQYILIILLFPFLSFSQGFTTSNGNLIDNNGNNFIMKGINVPLAWFVNDVTNSIDDVRINSGSNCLRIVVTTTTNEYSWQNAVLQCIENDMIPMVELHDVTGSTNTADVQRMADFWIQHADFLTQEGIVEYILVNICNEWGTWGVANTLGYQWRDAFNQAIASIRNAGINTTLVIDAVGYGQDIDDAKNIREYAAGMIENDPEHNLLFSIHMYCEWAQGGDDIAGTLQWARNNQIPLIVGEFGYQHATDGSCDIYEQYILDQCEASGIGWLAWSQKGNSGGVEYLDLCNDWACTNLSNWGNTIFNGRNGTNTAITCSVFEDNPSIPPVVYLTNPENNLSVAEPANITIEATATSLNGNFISVEFYANDVLLTTDNSEPYSFEWTGINEGIYEIYAKATDEGGSSNSEVISISITATPDLIELRTGWNLIGCPLQDSTEIQTALENILEYVEIVKDMDGYFTTQQPTYLNSLNEVVWGKGYFIKVSENCELEW